MTARTETRKLRDGIPIRREVTVGLRLHDLVCLGAIGEATGVSEETILRTVLSLGLDNRARGVCTQAMIKAWDTRLRQLYPMPQPGDVPPPETAP